MAIITPTVTGYSGFWNEVGPAGPSGSGPYQPKYARAGEIQRAAIPLGKRGFRKYRAQIRALIGAAPGGTATDSYRRVQGLVPGETDGQHNGGLRPTQVVNNDTVTTAAMVTAIQDRLLDSKFRRTRTYPVDRSGNGGGGKRNR